MFCNCNAAFSAIVLHALGKGLVSTKYALFSSVAYRPAVYLTSFDGWKQDKYNVTSTLQSKHFGVWALLSSHLLCYRKQKLTK